MLPIESNFKLQTSMPDLHTPEFLAARHAAMLAQTGFVGVDELDPTGPSGHAYGLRVSSRLTSDYRKRLKRGIVDVTPQEVIDCLPPEVPVLDQNHKNHLQSLLLVVY